MIAVHVPPSSGPATELGLVLHFDIHGAQTGPFATDIDNLCEPVLSVVINQRGWFGKRRPNLQWYCASKSLALSSDVSGCHIQVMQTQPANTPFDRFAIILDAEYRGILPRSARDSSFSNWVREKTVSEERADRYGVCIQFGHTAVNIGDIATGRVKSIIDCLYPILGGVEGAPEDWRIVLLQIEKNAATLKADEVRIVVARIIV